MKDLLIGLLGGILIATIVDHDTRLVQTEDDIEKLQRDQRNIDAYVGRHRHHVPFEGRADQTSGPIG